MSSPISRRDFLHALRPRWATKRNFIAAVMSVGVMIGVALVVSILRDVRFFNVLKLSLIGSGFVCALFLLSRVASLLQRTFKKSPPVIQALVVVVLQLACGVVVCTIGAYVYTRWQAAEDKTSLTITLASAFVFNFLHEWEKRSSNHRKILKGNVASASTAEP
ncbi:MAG: hypothetical protein QM790_00965 [Nibricoccus sp.]